MKYGQGFAPFCRQLFGASRRRPVEIDWLRISKRARELASGEKCRPVRLRGRKGERENGSGFLGTLFPVFMMAMEKKGG
jgi:hypothetical protein